MQTDRAGCASPDQRRRIEFAAAYQSECAAGGRYGALRIVPAVPAPRQARIHREEPWWATEKEAVSYQLSAGEESGELFLADSREPMALAAEGADRPRIITGCALASRQTHPQHLSFDFSALRAPLR